jgi:hypothetical protein
LPRLSSLSQELGNPQPVSSYVYAVLMVVLGLVGIFLGGSQFRSNKQKYFRYALWFILIGLLGIGFLATQMMISTLGSIYSTTYQLQ